MIRVKLCEVVKISLDQRVNPKLERPKRLVREIAEAAVKAHAEKRQDKHGVPQADHVEEWFVEETPII